MSVLSPAIDYNQPGLQAPIYKFEPQFPNTFGAPIAISATLNTITFNLPVDVMNLSRSYLMGNLNLLAPTVGTNYIWTYDDIPFREFQHIQLYCASNAFLMDLDQVQNYMKIIAKKETCMDEYLSQDFRTNLYQSNNLVNAVPALRHNSDNAVSSAVPNPSSRNYVEPAYFSVGDLGAARTIPFCYPMRLLAHTLCSMDMNVYFGQLLYLKLYAGTISKICYMSTSNASPSAGVPVPLVPATGHFLSSLQLMLAVDTNPVTRNALINEVQSPAGKDVWIPYVQANTFSNNGPNQTISMQIDQGLGQFLERILHSVFNNQQSLDTAYDCANNAVVPAGSVNRQKVGTFYTQFNGKRLQDITVDCTVATLPIPTDYMSMSNKLRGSVLQNLSEYQYNWFWEDDFSQFSGETDQEKNPMKLISGVALDGRPVIWSIVMTMNPTATNTNYIHYNYGVYTRKLHMSPQVVSAQ